MLESNMTMDSLGKKSISIVEQSAWKSSEGAKPSMPLAGGYLKACVLDDDYLNNAYNVSLYSFAGYESIPDLIKELFADSIPDIFAFSVLGWNIRTAQRLATVYKQLKPNGQIIWGGNHVSYQGDKVLRECPDVDVIVNGEGELTWTALLKVILEGRKTSELHDIKGISFRAEDGQIITTQQRERIANLDIIPSPFLTGAIDLVDAQGQALYDFALMETNRGCPYTCSFCYWGGAIGTKIRSFSTQRLKQEIEILAKAGYSELSLCDANFGMLRSDEEFLEICISAKKKYGYPQYFFTSWAKNKNKIFYRILHRMKEERLTSTFNLALQTLTIPALEKMHRKNMAINDWEPLAEHISKENLDVYAEFVWGCPGESRESFLESYDRLSEHVHEIAIYPLLIMPNTHYANKKKELGLITFNGGNHDFELVLSHPDMSAEDNREMQRFCYWARLLAEHSFFRYIWKPLRKFAGITQSQFILSFDRWIDSIDNSITKELKKIRYEVQSRLETDEELLEMALQILYREECVNELFMEWWMKEIEPKVDLRYQTFLKDVFKLDLLARPRYRQSKSASYSLRNVEFSYDILKILKEMELEKIVFKYKEKTSYNITFLFQLERGLRLFHNVRNKMYFARVRTTKKLLSNHLEEATCLEAL